MGLLKIRSPLTPGEPWVGQEGPRAGPDCLTCCFTALTYLKASVFQQ